MLRPQTNLLDLDTLLSVCLGVLVAMGLRGSTSLFEFGGSLLLALVFIAVLRWLRILKVTRS